MLPVDEIVADIGGFRVVACGLERPGTWGTLLSPGVKPACRWVPYDARSDA